MRYQDAALLGWWARCGAKGLADYESFTLRRRRGGQRGVAMQCRSGRSRRKIWIRAKARPSYSPRIARFATSRRRAWPRPAECSASIVSCVNTTRRARNRLARSPPTSNRWTPACRPGTRSQADCQGRRKVESRREEEIGRQGRRQGRRAEGDGEEAGHGPWSPKRLNPNQQQNRSQSPPTPSLPMEGPPTSWRPSQNPGTPNQVRPPPVKQNRQRAENPGSQTSSRRRLTLLTLLPPSSFCLLRPWAPARRIQYRPPWRTHRLRLAHDP